MRDYDLLTLNQRILVWFLEHTPEQIGDKIYEFYLGFPRFCFAFCIPLSSRQYISYKRICDAVRAYLIDHSTIENEDAEKVTFTILKEQLQTPND